METFNANKVDGRTRSYRETVRRIKERQERLKDKDGTPVKEPVLKPNPFGHPVAEIHSSKEGPEQRAQKDAAIAAWKKAGGQVKKIKPSLKGMSKNRKAIVKTRKEEVEMNKKYLDTRPASLEAAAYQSANTEVPVNPNSLRPTLHLPKNKYLQTKEGSLERAVEEALVTEASATKKQVKMAKGIANDPRHKAGDMTGAYKKAEKIKKGLGDHPKVQKALRKANEDSVYARKTREQAVDVINAIQFGKPFIVGEQEIPSAELREKEVDVKDTRRTDDAIDAYDKSKDASRDADWDTVHGKIKQGKKEKKYAKKERGEIGKDDPNWKSRSYHTGMHGEEMSPLIQATMEKIHFMRDDKLSYKERQKLPSGSFALPGKGSGPEGKQGGSYPIPDESHARNALARVSQHGSEAEKAKVRKAVASKYPNIKISEGEWADEKRKEKESSDRLLKIHQEREKRYQAQQAAKKQANEEDDRGIGSTGYANYVKGLTPGQESDSAVKDKDAKKASSESKKANDERERQATKIDDEYVPTLEEYAAHIESLDEVALESELETLSQNQLLELLGSGLVKKAVGAVAKRFSTGGRLAAAKKKATKIQQKTDLAKTKTSNIAAKAKLKTAKAKLKAAKRPAKPAPAAAPVTAEYNPESLIGRAMDELSKK